MTLLALTLAVVALIQTSRVVRMRRKAVRHDSIVDGLIACDDLIIWSVTEKGDVLFSCGGGLKTRLGDEATITRLEAAKGYKEGLLVNPANLRNWPDEGGRNMALQTFFKRPERLPHSWTGKGYDGKNWRNRAVASGKNAVVVSICTEATEQAIHDDYTRRARAFLEKR